MGIFDQIGTMQHEQVVFCADQESGLKAIIAIHDTTLGPSLGGCRFWNYASEADALTDVLRLSRGMTYKAAVAGLSLGGGKAVIIGDPKKLKSEGLFRAFGRFVESLGGRYISAEDVNVGVEDVENMALETQFVTGLATTSGGSGNPSPITALGNYHGIRAAVHHKLKRESLKDIRVAVQGCGSVGESLVELLIEDKARVVISDIDEQKVQRLADKYRIEAIDTSRIHAADVDVYAPCALGAVLNDDTIPQLRASIVAGAANNQLRDEDKHGNQLKSRGILYAPDYVINAGGLINVYHELKGYHAEDARRQTGRIFDTLLRVFTEADAEGISTHTASARIAERRIATMTRVRGLRNRVGNQTWIHRRLS